MSMQLLGYSPEENIDFYIDIGLYPKYERQNRMDKLYKCASEILFDALSVNKNTA